MPKSVKEKYKYLFVDILDNPRNLNTVGNPEQLKHTEEDMWSRELTKKDRIVYGIEQGINDVHERNADIIYYPYNFKLGINAKSFLLSVNSSAL